MSGHNQMTWDLPRKLEGPFPLKIGGLVAVMAGTVAFLWALITGHGALAWGGFLIGAFLTLSLALFGAVWIAMQYLSKGAWSVPARRIPEAMSRFLLPAGLLSLLVLFGAHDLYHWSHPEAVAADPLLTHKAPFLNGGMFLALCATCFFLFVVFAQALVSNSRRQDETGKLLHSQRNVVLSAVFMVVFALGYSVVSFYYLMSLDAHWFSTMFAVLTFTDLMQTGLAVVALTLAWMLHTGRLTDYLNENHLHDTTKMMFAFTGFWAYIYFCQFLLIWYANIPEETAYFLVRMENGWLAYLLLLPLLKFVIPFVYLVPRGRKRDPRAVMVMAGLVIFAQFWELYVMVAPVLGHDGVHQAAHPPVVELLIVAGFLGAFVLVACNSFTRHLPLPIKDPLLRQGLQHEL